jgi:hypothetical protein
MEYDLYDKLTSILYKLGLVSAIECNKMWNVAWDKYHSREEEE